MVPSEWGQHVSVRNQWDRRKQLDIYLVKANTNHTWCIEIRHYGWDPNAYATVDFRLTFAFCCFFNYEKATVHLVSSIPWGQCQQRWFIVTKHQFIAITHGCKFPSSFSPSLLPSLIFAHMLWISFHFPFPVLIFEHSNPFP